MFGFEKMFNRNKNSDSEKESNDFEKEQREWQEKREDDAKKRREERKELLKEIISHSPNGSNSVKNRLILARFHYEDSEMEEYNEVIEQAKKDLPKSISYIEEGVDRIKFDHGDLTKDEVIKKEHNRNIEKLQNWKKEDGERKERWKKEDQERLKRSIEEDPNNYAHRTALARYYYENGQIKEYNEVIEQAKIDLPESLDYIREDEISIRETNE